MIRQTLCLSILIGALFSCSTSFVRKYTKGQKNNVLAKESMLRYGDQQLRVIRDNSKGTKSWMASCHLQDFDKALTSFRQNLKKYEKNPEYWNQIGNCYFLKGENSKAIFFYKLASQTAKKNRTSYPAADNNLGVVYFKQRFYDEAFRSLRTAMKLNPRMKTPRFNLANIYMKFGLIGKAKQEAKRLYNVNSNDTDVLLLMGTISLVENRIEKSLEYFSKIEDSQLERQDISNHYALALFLKGELERAKELVDSQKKLNIFHLDVMSRQLREKIDYELRSRESS